METNISKKENNLIQTKLLIEPEKLLKDNSTRGKTAVICRNENLTKDDTYNLLLEIKKEHVQPYTFLSNLLADTEINEPTKPTEITNKFAILRKRVELNHILLEKTHRYVEDATFLTKKQNLENHYEINSTIQNTLRILDNMKKITAGEVSFEDFPEDLINNIEIED